MSATTTAAPVSTQAPPQGGVLEGLNPIKYSDAQPINLFIIQACIIIVFCRLLHYPLSLLAQPRVIAEVIGGIILGPSVMMRIPGFKDNIFPTDSMPVLNNAATLGLLMFLFLIGLEVDTRLFKSNWNVALYVGLAGMILPFGLGFAVAYGIFHQFREEFTLSSISFPIFGLFIGTALAITAFPVLCRILSELQLLGTPVGVTVLAAGIGNDVTGWILLALSVALVNNSNGLTALYVFLTATGWVLFLVFGIRPVFIWILRRTGSIQNGPSPGIIALTLILVLFSAWFTASIGVHVIFGAFLIGVICPHDGGFAIKLTEKIEDLVSTLLLPLYFALSGLSTDLGLLNDGMTWAYVVAIIVIAFAGKIAGGTLAARACKMLWRESITIGVLMSCKGLVELIVLNIGLQAGILSQKTFTMFVIMALVTTVATTPLAKKFYPPEYRKKVERWRAGEIDWEGNPITTEDQLTEARIAKTLDDAQTSNVSVHLRLDTLSGLFNLVSLIGNAKKDSPAPTRNEEKGSPDEKVSASSSAAAASRPLEVHGVRLVELGDRTSSVMQSTELEDLVDQDAVFSAFQTFSQLNDMAVAGHFDMVPATAFADTLVERTRVARSDLMLIPWSMHGSLKEDVSLSLPAEYVSQTDRFQSRSHIDFVQMALERSPCTAAVLITKSLDDPAGSKRPATLQRSRTGLSVQSARDGSPVLLHPANKTQRILLPFVGGADDRAALLFVLQLAHNKQVSVTVAHVSFPSDGPTAEQSCSATGPSITPVTDKTAVNEPSASDLELLNTTKKTVISTGLKDRVQFVDINVDSLANVPERVLEQARTEVSKSPHSPNEIVVVGRRHTCLRRFIAGESALERDFQKAVGVLAERIARSGIKASVLVINAAPDE